MSTALRPKNIPAVVAATVVMSGPSPIGFLGAVVSTVDPSLIGFLMFFWQSQLTHLLYIFLKHMTLFWWLIFFFIDEFFIFSLKSIICKKYRSANGNKSNYTNDIDTSIIWSCGGSVGDAGSFIACIVSSAGSFIAWIGNISTTFFSIV